MYRCTECQTQFTECPDFCDCGNDTFEEIYEQETYYEEEEEYYEPPKPRRRKPKKRVLTEEELEELEEEKADKKKALIVVCISLLISIIILCCPPYPKKKIEKVKEQVAATPEVTIPDSPVYWDNSLPAAFRKGDSDSHLPLLNANFSHISNNLRQYLVVLGEEFSIAWNPNLVEGSGECQIQFTINRDGVLENKKMIYKSRNSSLDDSVLLLLSKVTNMEIPPTDYKGERIVLAFKVDEKSGSKVYYPMPKKK